MHKVDPRYPNLRILTLTEEVDTKRLLLLLCGIFKIEDDEFLRFHEPQLKLPGAAIARMVLPHHFRSIGAQTAIIESDYVDRDTNIAYSQLYARAFRDYPRRTVRLHFFGKQINACEELIEEESLQKSYLGFCVLSSARPAIIGRTVLPSPKGDESWFFVPTQSEFSLNLSGAQLKAKGTAFLQQDGRVAACASAATWMSTVISARRFTFDMPVRSMAEITDLATKYSLPPSGRGSLPGLTVEQILWALHEMNYEPLSHSTWDPKRATELVYSSVESGIPPILVIYLPESPGFHAVTVVGHTYNPDLNLSTETNNQNHSVAAWCPYFLVHDDQSGPYLKIKFGAPTQRSKGRPSILIDETDSIIEPYKEEVVKWYRDASLHYVITPFPPRHILRLEQAVIKAKAILTEAYSLHAENLGIQLPSCPIYRTYFMSSNEFKNRFVGNLDRVSHRVPGLSPELAHWYRGSNYPRYIWVTELCGLEHRSATQPDNLRIVADVTIDPTSSPFSLDFVTLHLPRTFFRMSPDATNVASALRIPVAFIQDDEPYQPLVRIEIAQPPTVEAH